MSSPQNIATRGKFGGGVIGLATFGKYGVFELIQILIQKIRRQIFIKDIGPRVFSFDNKRRVFIKDDGRRDF